MGETVEMMKNADFSQIVPAGEPRAPREPDDEIDLLALVSHLWAGKYWILAAAILALLGGVFVVLRATPIYEADALVQIETRSGAMGLPQAMQDLLSGDSKGDSAVANETEILKSRMVIGEAVQELGMQIQAAPRPFPLLGKLPSKLGLTDHGILTDRSWGNESIEIGDLKVPQDWQDLPLRLTKTGPDQFTITLPDDETLSGAVGQRLSGRQTSFSLLVNQIEGPDGRAFDLTFLSLPDAVEKVQARLTVSQASRNSSLLNLSYQDPDPRQAERVLDAIAQAYVAQNIARGSAEADNSLQFIEKQLPKAQAAVDDAQQALNKYRQAQQSVDVDYETRSLLERATAIETQLNALSLQEEDLKKHFTPNHPAYQVLLDNRAALEAQLAEIRKETAALPETQKEIFNLTRSFEVASQIYTQLRNRAEELRVVKASTVGSVRIIDNAYSNGQAVSPRTARVLALSLVLGLFIGMAFILLRRLWHRGISGAEEIEQSGLPVFGVLNFEPDAINHRKRRGLLPIHALTKRDSLVVESLRSLRTALHFGLIDAKTKSVLLTSASPGVGKSYTAINLAIVAAQAGQKVCVIDADLRKGYLRRYLGRDKETPGLADFLAKTHELDEILIPGPVDGLSVILTGHYPPNPSELLLRPELGVLINHLDKEFDLILIDSPPALAVTDPVVISRQVGATIMVVRHLITMKGEIEAVRRAFEIAGSKISGAVLNAYRQEHASSYGNYSYYYNYRYRYQKGQK